ncbi:hypothetical protein JD844_031664 [Phrynosoma platyrhinos]|uniref:Synaptotagmin-like mitochondrial and lipid-binding domain-containing protein n=1 Tax=Phrynosoma platyrhinos TaxID=52577 RepID=A0ABQ7T1H4_PHRPL|nr:hypothetical protein JD844_031664 [Phrynosoma platyrhinos]
MIFYLRIRMGLKSSIQITFEESPQHLPAVSVSHVSCTDRSDRGMMLQCHLSADAMQFPISVTQQSPAAVSMDTYQVTLAVLWAQLEIRLEEMQDEGLLVSWAFKGRPDLSLSVVPRLQLRDENDGKVDQSTIKDLIEDSVISTQPAMMVNLKACVTGGNLSSCNKLYPGSPSGSAAPMVPKLLLQNLRGRHLGSEETPGGRQLCCVVEMDSPQQQKRTKPVPASSSGPAAEVEWPDKLVLDLGPRSKELKLSVLGSSSNSYGGSPREEVLLGFAAIPLNSPSKDPRGQQIYSLKPGPFQKLPPAAAVAVELLYQEPPEHQQTSSLRTSITPTKKVEMDRTIMPDGTIVTTVTTIQSRPKADCKLDSPSRSPSKVEVTEKVTTMLPQNGCPISASPTSSRKNTSSLDDKAERLGRERWALIRRRGEWAQSSIGRGLAMVTCSFHRPAPQVPIAEDEMALSLGYAASLEGTLQDDSILAGMSEYTQSFTDPTQQQLEASYAAQRASQDLDETTRSDISERASVDDVESETGSMGALETRSLKDHKVNFLRSGTKLIFRRKNKQKEAGLSQSHDDLPNASAGSAARKKSGSFSRRLIKRFSFKTKSKPKANGSTMAADKH